MWVGMLTGCGPAGSDRPGASATPARGEPIVGEQIASRPVPAASPVTPIAAPAPAITSAPPVAAVATKTTGYPALGFDRLAAYNFVLPEDGAPTNQTAALEQANSQIPAVVKALDAKRFAIKGFMLPLKVDAGEVTEFLLMKDQSMCCYGNAPRINEWISVKTGGKGIKAVMDQPVSIEGTLHVGATRENGYLVGLYQMEGERMVDPPAN